MHMGCGEYFITPECKQIDLSPSEIDLSPDEIDSPPYKQWLSLALKRVIQWFTKIYSKLNGFTCLRVVLTTESLQSRSKSTCRQ